MATNSKTINRNTRFALWGRTYGDNEAFTQLVNTRTKATTLREALNKAAAEHAASGDLTEQGVANRMRGIREATRGEITKLREMVINRARTIAEPLRPQVAALDDKKLDRLIHWWREARQHDRMNAVAAAVMGRDDDLARAICTEPRHFPLTMEMRSLVEKRFIPEHDPTIDDLLHASRLVDEELEEIEKELA